MATTKRMFSNDIVGSDAFIEMPSTSQALYFHLGMRCDDDGFVNPNTTMRMTGANKNDLDILIGKRFLLAFKNGVVVIKHHRINNNWDSRDCRRTLYTEQLAELLIKDNNSYTFDDMQGIPVSDKYIANKANISKKVLPDGNPTETRRQNRIEENRIEENRIEENRIEENRIDTCVAFDEWYSLYPSKKARADGEKAWLKLNEEQKHKALTAIKVQIEVKHFSGSNGKDFIPLPATWLNGKRWEDEIIKKETFYFDGRTK